MPDAFPLSSKLLVRFGLYLIDDVQSKFLWVGEDVVPRLVMDVFRGPGQRQDDIAFTRESVLATRQDHYSEN